ncbi:MAG: hypothetical protein HZC54_19830 [Verrucomicrobia bacterium]|nr:hypothetical protein [Verrucomicrobiota bacterium]
MRSEPIKHSSFDSIYRHEYTIVEERHGNVSLFPHTDQLPVISRAINLEFYGALPPSVARVDHRADAFHKIMLKEAASMFCYTINGARADKLRLHDLPTEDFVYKIAVIQQITEQTRRGPHHRFRFYSGDRFLPDIHLCGKSLVITDHVLQRFTARVPHNICDDIYHFLIILLGGLPISMSIGPGHAIILYHERSILAFTYEETDTEYILTTCLTLNEIHTMKPDLPPLAMNFHFGPGFVPPRIRNWKPTEALADYLKIWKRKEPFEKKEPRKLKPLDWHWLAYWCRDYTIKKGHGPGSSLCFMDGIHGPRVLEILPGHRELQYDELAAYKHTHPQYDWDTAFAERDAKLSRPKPSAAHPPPPSPSAPIPQFPTQPAQPSP